MNSILTYVPRAKNGRFVSFRKKATKVIIYQLIVLSVVLNLYQWRQAYVITCAAGGHFMTRQACGDEADAKFAETQLAQTQNQLQELQTNSDLYAK